MAYLNNTSITVDAILTKKGRELLARGRNEFQITQFALADDEIDYDLWNPAHPLGSNYYGIIIENMPLVEAVPDESQMMKYKLVTLPKNSTRIPVLRANTTSVTLTNSGQRAVITPSTVNFAQGNSTLGYTAILSDNTVCDIVATRPAAAGISPSVPRFIGDGESAQSVAVTGFEFEVVAKTQLVETKTATVTLIGNETGGRVVVTVTVLQTQLTTANTGIGLVE